MDALAELGQRIGWTLLEQSAGASTILTVLLFVIVHFAFDKLPKLGQQWIFAAATFIALTLLFVLFANALRPSPHLSASIDRIHVTSDPLSKTIPAPDAARLPKDEIGIIIIAGVSNSGMPSMANCCHLAITLPGANQPIVADGLTLPPMFNVQNGDGTQTIASYSSADALYDKLSTKPLTTGEMARGVLLFGVKGVTYANLTTPGTKYELEMTDVTGQPVIADFIWSITQTEGLTGYIPGLSAASNQCPPLPKANAN